MARTVLAVFESVFSASQAVNELSENGLNGNMIEIFPRPKGALETAAVHNRKTSHVVSEVDKDAHGIGLQVGAGIGAALGISGGLMAEAGALPLAWLEPLALPGVWTTVIVISIAALIGAAACAALGGLLGGLLGLNIPDGEIRQYARAARREPVMVAVLADWDSIDPVLQILNKHNPLELVEKPYKRPDSGTSNLSKRKTNIPGSAGDRR